MKLKRAFYIFKCRTKAFIRKLTIKFLSQISEWGWVVCHNAGYSNIVDIGAVKSAPDISTDRYVFSVSYVLREYENTREYWFETYRGKRVFTVEDNRYKVGIVSSRAELKAFYAHFSHRQRMWVYHTSPVIQVFESKGYLQDLPEGTDSPFKVNTYKCDFSQCRYAFEFRYALPTLPGALSEVISQSHRALEVQLTSKVTEINKILTGADCDGEMMSPKGMPLSENILCNHCGLPVFASVEDKYKFECLIHGDLSYDKIKRVDPVMYQKVLGYATDTIERLIEKSCPQDSNL